MRPHAPRQAEEAGQFPEDDRAEAECPEVGQLQVGEQQQVAGVTGAEGAPGGRGHGAAAGLGLAGDVYKTWVNECPLVSQFTKSGRKQTPSLLFKEAYKVLCLVQLQPDSIEIQFDASFLRIYLQKT